MPSFAYRVFGLRVRANASVPGWNETVFSQSADVVLTLGALPQRSTQRPSLWYQSPSMGRSGRPKFTIWSTKPGGAFHFVHDDGVEFVVSYDGREVWSSWPEGATLADAAMYLRGFIIGFVLRRQGVVCLHAAVIAYQHSAIALIGPSGCGKSTTAASFADLGYSFLSDDLAVLRHEAGVVYVQPGYPRVHLWPEAAAAMPGVGELPRLVPMGGINDWHDKRYLDLADRGLFHPTPLPLRAVYLIGDRAESDDYPRIENVSPRNAFVDLTDESYVNYALDEAGRAEDFRTIGAIVRSTLVRRVIPHVSPDRLVPMCRLILEDVATQSARYGESTGRSLESLSAN